MILKDKQLKIQYEEALDAYNQDNIKLSIGLFKKLADTNVPEACQMLSFIYSVTDDIKDNTKYA